MKIRFAMSSLVSAMGLFSAWPLAAQVVSQNSASAPSAGGEQDSQLQEIVVTAQRRSESLQKVPLSVTVATADTLQQRNYTDPAQLPFVVPSLQLTNFQGAPGATNFSIRGIGTESFSHLVEPSVATVIDGIVMSRPEMGVVEFSDLARVEVLNGPQGMLFGKNASAGLINIVTNRPKIGVLEGYSDFSYEDVAAAHDVGFYNVHSMLNVPLTEVAAARVTVFYTKDGSLLGNALPGGFDDFGRTEYGLRPKFLFDSGDGLSIYLSGDYAKSEGMGTGVDTPRSEGPALAPLWAAVGITPSANNLYQSGDAPTDLHYQIAGEQAEIAYAFANGLTLTDIAGYRSYVSHHTIDLDLSQVNLLDTTAARFRFEQFTEELRLTSPTGGAFDYQAGLFYFHGFDRRQDQIRGQLGMSVPPPDGSATWLGLNAQDDLHPDSYAAYAQGTYHLTDKFSLTGGGRLTYDHLRFVGGYNQDDIFITIAGLPGANSYRESESKTNFSWRTSAGYAFTPAVNGYLTVASGYKGPGYNLSWAGNPGGQPVGAETSMDYEFGVKSTLFDRLLLNVAVYWENFSDFQVQSFQASGVPGVGSFIIQNAGKLRARGLEETLSYRVTPALTLSANGAFNDAIYLRFPGAPCYVGQTVGQGCVDGAVDASGNRLANAPKLTGTLAADYQRPLVHNLSLLAHGDVYSRSGVNFSANNDPHTVQGPYTTLNASIGIAGSEERWTVRAYCRNCADRRFVAAIDSNVVGGAGDYGQSFAVDSFRAIGLGVNVRY